jgi:hypothetical protein
MIFCMLHTCIDTEHVIFTRPLYCVRNLNRIISNGFNVVLAIYRNLNQALYCTTQNASLAMSPFIVIQLCVDYSTYEC